MDQKEDLKMKSIEISNHVEKLWQQQLIGEISYTIVFVWKAGSIGHSTNINIRRKQRFKYYYFVSSWNQANIDIQKPICSYRYGIFWAVIRYFDLHRTFFHRCT